MLRPRWFAAVSATAALTIALTACTVSGGSNNDASSSAGGASSSSVKSPSSSSKPKAPLAVITTNPAAGAQNVSPIDPIKVSVAAGTLSAVSLVSDAGVAVKGAINADKTSWNVAEPLGYGKSYTLNATSTNADGVTAKKVSTFSTVTPTNLTMPYIDTTGGGDISNGGTYGVGVVINIHWDEDITNRAAAEKAVTITTTPAVKGAWYWANAQEMHWRPAAFWTPGTKVNVLAHAYGAQVGPGLYGQADASTNFKIGESHVSVADDATHQVSVYVGGKLARTMPTSMGRGGYVQGSSGSVSLYTPSGTYTVIGQGNPVLMDSSTFGLPTNSPLGYKENIYWATRISTDGIFLHALESTIWAQGNTDVSHGCLNLSPDNAQWYYRLSQIGDPVTVKHTGGAALQVWQNGDWTVPWAQWVKGGVNQ